MTPQISRLGADGSANSKAATGRPASQRFCPLSGLRNITLGKSWRIGIAVLVLGAWQPTVPISAALGPKPDNPNGPPPAAGANEATETPRERDRVLQKRNPISSEYQVIEVLGRGPGAQADGESSDFRAFLPMTGDLLARNNERRFETVLTMQTADGHLEPGFDARVRHRSGTGPDDWALELRANLNAARRVIEDYEALWTPVSGASMSDPVYFLQRPKLRREQLFTRTRNLLMHFEHRPRATHTLFAQASWADYFDDSVMNQVDFDSGGDQGQSDFVKLAPNGTTLTEAAYTGVDARRYFRLANTNRDILRFQAGGRYDGNDWSAGYAAYHASWTNKLLAEGWNFLDSGLPFSYRVDAWDPYFPALSLAPEFDFGANAPKSVFADYRNVIVTTRDRDWAGRIDVQQRHTLGGGTFWLSGGILHRRKERSNAFDGKVYFAHPDRPLTLVGIAGTEPVGNVLRGRYALLPPALRADVARNAAAAGASEVVLSPERSAIESGQEQYRSDEAVTGTYAYISWRPGSWHLEAGLRGEHTQTQTRGTVIVPALEDNGEGALQMEVVENGELLRIREVPGSDNYNSWLPSLGVEWQVAPDWTVRAVGYTQLMRPQYFDIVHYRRVSLTTAKIREGNPALGPVNIRTGMIAVTHQSPWWGEWTLAGYASEISGFFYNAQAYESIGGVLYTVSRIENGDRGGLHGIQAQWRRRFAIGSLHLSPFLAYTYSDSETKMPTRPGDMLPLPERARHLLRAETSWSCGKLNGTVEYTYQTPSLDQVGPSNDRDIYRDTVQALDLTLGWRLTAQWRITAAAQNIADVPERSYEGDPIRAIRSQYRSTTIRLGMAAVF